MPVMPEWPVMSGTKFVLNLGYTMSPLVALMLRSLFLSIQPVYIFFSNKVELLDVYKKTAIMPHTYHPEYKIRWHLETM